MFFRIQFKTPEFDLAKMMSLVFSCIHGLSVGRQRCARVLRAMEVDVCFSYLKDECIDIDFGAGPGKELAGFGPLLSLECELERLLVEAKPMEDPKTVRFKVFIDSVLFISGDQEITIRRVTEDFKTMEKLNGIEIAFYGDYKSGGEIMKVLSDDLLEE